MRADVPHYKKFCENRRFCPYTDFDVLDENSLSHRITDFAAFDPAMIMYLRSLLDPLKNKIPPFFLTSAAISKKFRQLYNYIKTINT